MTLVAAELPDDPGAAALQNLHPPQPVLGVPLKYSRNVSHAVEEVEEARGGVVLHTHGELMKPAAAAAAASFRVVQSIMTVRTFIRPRDFFTTAASPVSPLTPPINIKQLIRNRDGGAEGAASDTFDRTGRTRDVPKAASSSYEASSIGPSSSSSAWLARISIRVRAKRPQSSAWVADS